MLNRPSFFPRYTQRVIQYFLPSKKQRLLKTVFYKVIRKSDVTRWKLDSNLYPDWEERTAIMAQWIPENSSIMEFGCGNMALKKYLPDNCHYFPSDLVSRDSNTFVIDLNQSQPLDLPKKDLYFFSGVLEYIYDIEQLVKASENSCKSVILSYTPCVRKTTDLILRRRAEGWVNDYSGEELIDLFGNYNFTLKDRKEWRDQWLLYLELTT
jgi:hypothetical protein